MGAGHVPILIIEDSDEDYEVTVWALRRAEVPNPLWRCTTGQEALPCTRRQGAYADPMSPVPCLVLLDLNLPGVDGREASNSRHGEGGSRIPIVVLSTSSNPRDVTWCDQCGACGYLIKPMELRRFKTMMRACMEYWLKTVTLPEA